MAASLPPGWLRFIHQAEECSPILAFNVLSTALWVVRYDDDSESSINCVLPYLTLGYPRIDYQLPRLTNVMRYTAIPIGSNDIFCRALVDLQRNNSGHQCLYQ